MAARSQQKPNVAWPEKAGVGPFVNRLAGNILAQICNPYRLLFKNFFPFSEVMCVLEGSKA